MIKKSEVFLFKNLIVKTKKSQIKNKEIKGDRRVYHFKNIVQNPEVSNGLYK